MNQREILASARLQGKLARIWYFLECSCLCSGQVPFVVSETIVSHRCPRVIINDRRTKLTQCGWYSSIRRVLLSHTHYCGTVAFTWFDVHSFAFFAPTLAYSISISEVFEKVQVEDRNQTLLLPSCTAI